MAGTKWNYNFEGCLDIIDFKENHQYEFSSCEIGEILSGVYILKNDTLVLNQHRGSFDQGFPKDSKHRTQDVKYILLINQGTLLFKERWEQDILGNWHKTSFQFPDDYVFKKMQ